VTALLAAAGTAGPFSPPPARADSLVLSAQVDTLKDADDGSGVELTWLRRDSRDHRSAGLGVQRIGGAEWWVGTLGVSRAVTPRWRLSADLRLGPGRRDEVRFTYAMASASASFTALPGRLGFDLTQQYVDVDVSYGGLVKVGGWWAPRPQAIAQLTYTASVGGNLDVGLLSGRLDLPRTRPGLFGGVAVGSTASVLLGPLPGAGTTQNHYREVYAGIRLAAERRPLEIVLDRQRGDGLRKVSLIVVYRLPLGGRGGAP
jgi:hypothetical protein